MERLLVVLPHPDDEAFGAAGMMAQYREKGWPVTHVCATSGQMGRNMGKPPFANRETLYKFREKELKAACDALGVEDVRMLGMRDKTLEFENPEVLADRMEEIIREVNPTIVVSFYPEHGIHPDHDALGAAVVNAASRLGEQERPKVYLKAILPNSEQLLGEPDVVIDVTDVLDKKIEALKAHASQIPGIVREWEERAEKRDPELVKWLGYERFWMYSFS
ncbi:MAG TPA: bacillithiol biosynthesis deacetylase BshB2 [Bacillales bacterium]|nr:bacillithiol biosynthesis deacetylase BshB2 [Bacillales bacterium]